MSNNYVFMSCNRITTMKGVICADRHNERLRGSYPSNPDIRPECSLQNYHIKECSKRYDEFVEDELSKYAVRPSKRSVLMLDSVVSPTPEWIMAMNAEEQRCVFTRAYGFFENVFRREHIISAVVHMDETHPHMHIDLVPITEDGRLCFSSFFPWPDGMVRCQDEFFSHMQEAYPDLSRGISQQVSKRIHVRMPVFKAAPDYFNHHEEILKAVMEIDRPFYRIEQNKAKLMELYSGISVGSANLILSQQNQLRTYENKTIPKMRAANEELEDELVRLRSRNAELTRSLSSVREALLLSRFREQEALETLTAQSEAFRRAFPAQSVRISEQAERDRLRKRLDNIIGEHLRSFGKTGPSSAPECPHSSVPDR